MALRLLFMLGLLGAGMLTLSTVIFVSGLDETRLAMHPGRHEVTAAELPGVRGVVSVLGCMRHDLGVAVSDKRGAFRLGSGEVHRPEPLPKYETRTGNMPSESEVDRVFVPLAAADDCDEDQPPKALYALVENDDSVGGTTITFGFARGLAPPPVRAIVNGVVGYGVGHGRKAARARDFWRERGRDLDALPLLVKGKQPGVLWVSALTLAAGAHGYLLVLLVIVWLVRRQRRRRAILAGDLSDEEEQFFAAVPDDPHPEPPPAK